jgi:DNA-binding NarL/FixJ family response regulator
MNGREAIEQLHRYDPNVKAIVSSGYSNDPVIQTFAAYGFSGRLTKPYRINDIKNILEELIKK